MSNSRGFTLKQVELCVKCGESMPAGVEVSWLRDPEAKGFFHVTCTHLPALPGLVLRKLPDATQPLGFRWGRAGGAPLAPRTAPKAIMAVPGVVPQSTALAVKQAPATHIPGVIDLLVQAIMPQLDVYIAARVDAALAKVTVRVQREAQ